MTVNALARFKVFVRKRVTCLFIVVEYLPLPPPPGALESSHRSTSSHGLPNRESPVLHGQSNPRTDSGIHSVHTPHTRSSSMPAHRTFVSAHDNAYTNRCRTFLLL
mmetsp:Transcript_18032/g.37384  ORF Transcript_18032/g.37384 Transcript_18032/m.37384 type:complete len:106 (+) Transcript_18032:677-994(+)